MLKGSTFSSLEISGTELFDLNETDMQGISAKIVETLLNKGYLDKEEGTELMTDLMLSHRPVCEKKPWLAGGRRPSLQVNIDLEGFRLPRN